jgi:bleomycin hydrolase
MAKYYLTFLLIIFSVNCALGQPVAPTTIKLIPAGTVKYQGGTNTCWSFSTTSMIESGEMQNYHKDIDLSELYTARNLYIEKAKRYILSNGTTLFEAGGHTMLYLVSKNMGPSQMSFTHAKKA